MAQMMVFVSHCHEDSDFCRAVVAGLRDAGADVWYDKDNMGSGQLLDVIQRELGRRPVVMVILSKAAFASRWVRREVGWAYELLDRDPSRLLLPVTAGPIAREDFSPEAGWLFLYDFKRIEAADYQPYPPDEAIRHMLQALALTPTGETPAPTAPRPAESAADLLERAKALWAQKRYDEMLPLAQRATELAPNIFDAWFNLGRALGGLKEEAEALAAYDRALVLNPNYALVWYNRGVTLHGLTRFGEAVDAYDRALTLDPNHALSWTGRGAALYGLNRYDEAADAYDHALALEPTYALAWTGRGAALYGLNRYDEALAAFDRALAIDPTYAPAVSRRAYPLRALGRVAEAEAAERRAKELGG